MNFLEEKILADGCIRQGNILKVDNFINHQIDISIIRKIAQEFKHRFKDEEVTKILTIEASGIAIAVLLADLYGVPAIFAKKGGSANCTDDKYTSHAFSFTHKKTESVFVSKPYLLSNDKVLIVDDFLAEGQAMNALIDIVHQAGAIVAGCGVAIEKGFQKGGRELREQGYHVASIAIVDEMDYEKGTITFRN